VTPADRGLPLRLLGASSTVFFAPFAGDPASRRAFQVMQFSKRQFQGGTVIELPRTGAQTTQRAA